MSDPAPPNASAIAAAGAAGLALPAGSAETGEPLGFEPAGDRPTQSDRLGASTVRGSLWTVGSYFAVNVVRLGSNLILTRLLLPDLFGVMLIVNTVMTGIRLFSDVGIGPALISNPRGEQESFLRTAFTTQFVRGFIIWFAAAAIAVPAAHHYVRLQGDAYAVLGQLLPVAGFVAIIEGLRSTAIFRLQRRLRFAEQSLLDVIEIAVTAVGMVTWAMIQPSIWALVVPPLVGSLVAMVASHRLLGDRRDRLGWDAGSAQDLMRVGRWIFVSTVLSFLAGQVDRLIIGGYIGVTRFGVYSVAVGLALMPTVAVLKVGGSVLFPTFSRVAEDVARFADVYRRARTMLLTVAGLIVSGIIACAPFAIRGMYKPVFDDAGWMLQLLAIGVWFQIVDATNVAALLARRRPNWMAAGNLTKVVFMFTLVPVAYRYHGLGGALVALGLADAFRAVTSTIGVGRLGISRATLIPDFSYPFLIAAVGLLGLGVADHLDPHLASRVPDGKLGRFLLNGTLAAAAAVIVAALWGPFCVWQWRQTRRQTASASDTGKLAA